MPDTTQVDTVGKAASHTSIGASLSLLNVYKHYGSSAVVRDVNLEVQPGEFVTLLGASGSGKTTTLMMVAGFTDLTAGEILIDGKSVKNIPPARRNLGVVFQSYSLFPHLTVQQNLSFPLEMRRVGRVERERLVRQALEMVALPDKAESYPRQLSGGQQQRVALARALVFGPRVLLMDEPLGALDKKLREHMQLEIKRIQHELGATVIYVTHDQEEALTMSDRIAVMQHGSIEQIGSPADLYDRPATRWVADFVGQSNFINTRVLAVGTNGEVSVGLPGGTTTVVRSSANVQAGSSVTLVLRPEKLSISKPEDVNLGNRLIGTIAEVIYLGHATRSSVLLTGGMRLSVQQANRNDSGHFEPGQKVAVQWAHEDGWLVENDK